MKGNYMKINNIRKEIEQLQKESRDGYYLSPKLKRLYDEYLYVFWEDYKNETK